MTFRMSCVQYSDNNLIQSPRFLSRRTYPKSLISTMDRRVLQRTLSMHSSSHPDRRVQMVSDYVRTLAAIAFNCTSISDGIPISNPYQYVLDFEPTDPNNYLLPSFQPKQLSLAWMRSHVSSTCQVAANDLVVNIAIHTDITLAAITMLRPCHASDRVLCGVHDDNSLSKKRRLVNL